MGSIFTDVRVSTIRSDTAASLDQELMRKGEVDAAVAGVQADVDSAQAELDANSHAALTVPGTNNSLALSLDEQALTGEVVIPDESTYQASGSDTVTDSGLAAGDTIDLGKLKVSNVVVTADAVEATSGEDYIVDADTGILTVLADSTLIAAAVEVAFDYAAVTQGPALEVTVDGLAVKLGTSREKAARGDHTHSNLHLPLSVEAVNPSDTLNLAVNPGQRITGEVKRATSSGLTVTDGLKVDTTVIASKASVDAVVSDVATHETRLDDLEADAPTPVSVDDTTSINLTISGENQISGVVVVGTGLSLSGGGVVPDYNYIAAKSVTDDHETRLDAIEATNVEWLIQSGGPNNGDGENGDMSLDSDTGEVYGPKAAGDWGSPVANILSVPTGGTESQVLMKGSGTDFDTSWQTIQTSHIDGLDDAMALLQPLDATLTALAALTIAANSLTIGTGADAFSQTTFAANTFPARASTGDLVAKSITDFALTMLDDAAASDVRTTLGLGTMATAAAADYLPLAGGTMTGPIRFNGSTSSHALIKATGADFYFRLGDDSGYATSYGGVFGSTTDFRILGNQGALTTTGVKLADTVDVRWSSDSTFYGTADLFLLRDAAAVLALRNSTNAQTLRVYGTYTHASNYVRASLSSSSTAVTLAAQTAGTGADDIDIVLTPAGAGNVQGPQFGNTTSGGSDEWLRFYASAASRYSYFTVNSTTQGHEYQHRFVRQRSGTYTLAQDDSMGSLTWNTVAFMEAIASADAPGGYSCAHLRWRTQNAAGTTAERMRLTSEGNVGIGTTSPAAKLEVVSGVAPALIGYAPVGAGVFYSPTVNAADNASAPNAAENVLTLIRNGVAGQVYPSIAELRLSKTTTGSYGNTRLDFRLVNTDVSVFTTPLSLLGNGNVGIGTTAPGKALEVNLGTSSALRLTYNDADGSATTYMDTTLSSAGVATMTLAGSATGFVIAGMAVIDRTLLNTAVGISTLAANTTGTSNVAVGHGALYANTTGYGNSAVGYLSLFYNTTGITNAAFGNSSLYSNTTGSYNTATGPSALYSNTTGSYNTAVGYASLTLNTTGDSNTASGSESLRSNTTGIGNSAFGASALRSNTTANYNSAFGMQALYGNTSGSCNSAFGLNALYTNSTGADNCAFGYQSLMGNTTGSQNVSVGKHTLNSNTTGANNTAVGYYALALNTTATYNTAVGASALYYNTGPDNTAVGAYAGHANTTGGYNTSIGSSALYSNTTGANNVAVGYGAMLLNTTGANNVAVGQSSLYSNTTGANSTAVGAYALYSNTTGENNAAFGNQALYYNTTGVDNTAIGYLSLKSNTTGNYNTAVGVQALHYNTTGASNSAVGKFALYNNTTGTNTAVGAFALYTNTTGTYNSAFGYQALCVSVGLANSAFGHHALVSNTTGGYNAAVGYNVLFSNTTGSNNVAVGPAALYTNTTGGSNTALGSSALTSNTTASNNTGIGINALYANTTGASNTAVGSSALYSNTTGAQNSAFGLNSLYANTTGGSNAGFGAYALYSNTTGDYNSAVGMYALNANTVGTHNTAIGYGALYSNTEGIHNTALGYFALYANTTGNQNVALGLMALQNSTTGFNNTAVGYRASLSNTTGAHNTAVGTDALYLTTTGSSNSAFGYRALFSNTTGGYNSALGLHALYGNTTGDNNIAFGYYALSSNTTGYNNVAVGASALRSSTTGYSNSAFGTDALLANTTGLANTSVGFQSLRTNTTGANNAALGEASLYSNTTGSYNSSFGSRSLFYNTTGTENTSIGTEALYANTTGAQNTAVGRSALNGNTTGNYNTAAGYVSLQYGTTASNNTGFGAYTLYSASTGSSNTAIGHSALRYITTNGYNTAVGYEAGRWLANGSTVHELGASSVFIGYDTRAAGENQTNQIVIGASAIGLGSNTVVLGNSSITSTMLRGAVSFDNVDTNLSREASGVLALRNSTNAQTLRVYGTASGTPGTDYVRASLTCSTADVTLAAESGGSGNPYSSIMLKPKSSIGCVGVQLNDAAFGQDGFAFTRNANCTYAYSYKAGVTGSFYTHDAYGQGLLHRSANGLGMLSNNAIYVRGDSGVYLTGATIGAGAFTPAVDFYAYGQTTDGSGDLVVTGLTAGDYYSFEIQGNITSITNGTETLTTAGTYVGGFVMQGTSVTVHGPASTVLTGRFHRGAASVGIATKEYTHWVHPGNNHETFIAAFMGGGNQTSSHLRADLCFDARKYRWYVSKTGASSGYLAAGYEVLRLDEDSHVLIDPINTAGSRLGIGTATPTNTLSFGGNAARTIWMERRTTASTGYALTVQAGGAKSGETDTAGGDLYLLPGTSTGSAESGVRIQGCVAGASATTDRTMSTMLQVLGDKLGFFGATPVVQQSSLTAALTTITITDPGTPDYAMQDVTDTSPFGFADAEEARTFLSVVKNLQTRVNELETILSNLGITA